MKISFFNKYLLYFHTLKYLKLIQFIKRFQKYIVPKSIIVFCVNLRKKPNLDVNLLPDVPIYRYKDEFCLDTMTFTFLNQTRSVSSFNDKRQSMHWIFELNYFSFIHQIEDQDVVTRLILDWIEKYPIGTSVLWHPYPISLRICNWVWYISKYKQKINKNIFDTITLSIQAQLLYLNHNLEFELLGNHLYENIKALIIGGIFINDQKIINKGYTLFFKQTKEQFLEDGGHFERSPMYHAIMLDVMFMCYKALLTIKTKSELSWLKNYIEKGFNFLIALEFQGLLPDFNDSTSLDSLDVLELKIKLQSYFNFNGEFDQKSICFKQSGIFVYKSESLVLYMDIGKIGPDYLCGHAHNDILSFILHVQNQPVFTDSGVYDYAKGRDLYYRHYFRSTKAHNTIMIDDIELNQIWSSFRVAKRGYPYGIESTKNKVKCSHDCYKDIGVFITRQISIVEESKELIINDEIINKNKERIFTSFFHLHPQIQYVEKISKNKVKIIIPALKNSLFLECDGSNVEFDIFKTLYSPEFNKKIDRFSLKLQGIVGVGKNKIETRLYY